MLHPTRSHSLEYYTVPSTIPVQLPSYAPVHHKVIMMKMPIIQLVPGLKKYPHQLHPGQDDSGNHAPNTTTLALGSRHQHLFIVYNIHYIWYTVGVQAIGHVFPSCPGFLCRGGGDRPKHSISQLSSTSV